MSATINANANANYASINVEDAFDKLLRGVYVLLFLVVSLVGSFATAISTESDLVFQIASTSALVLLDMVYGFSFLLAFSLFGLQVSVSTNAWLHENADLTKKFQRVVFGSEERRRQRDTRMQRTIRC